MSNPIENNRRIWDERAREGKKHALPATEKDFQNARARVDQCGWLPKELRGVRVLCLAAGGGWHGPLFAHLGAEVTVVDISEEMLALDRKIADARGLPIKLLRASMDDLSALPPGAFEVVVQPVSSCYVPDVTAVYHEVAAVISSGGLYISQHKQPISLQASALPGAKGYSINHSYYISGPLPAETLAGLEHREAGAHEFIHRWEDLVGGLCRSGFVIEDLLEPRHADAASPPGTFPHRSHFIPPYVTIKARRVVVGSEKNLKLWVPA